MLETGAAARAGWNLKFIRGIEELLLQPSIQVLEVLWMRRGLVVQFVLPDVLVALCGLSLPLTPLQSGGMVVMVVVVVMPAVGIAVCLVFVMFVVSMQTVAIAVLVLVVVMMVVVTVIRVAVPVTHGFLRVQRGPLALRCSAVLPHLIDEEDFGHVVYDEHLGPVRDWLGFSSTEMNVHDKDGERSGGCDHSHGGYVVLPWRGR